MDSLTPTMLHALAAPTHYHVEPLAPFTIPGREIVAQAAANWLTGGTAVSNDATRTAVNLVLHAMDAIDPQATIILVKQIIASHAATPSFGNPYERQVPCYDPKCDGDEYQAAKREDRVERIKRQSLGPRVEAIDTD
jgi:hypothetical protein